MHGRQVKPVENYTNAFLVSAGVLLFSLLVILWGLIGYIPALVLAAVVNVLIPSARA